MWAMHACTQDAAERAAAMWRMRAAAGAALDGFGRRISALYAAATSAPLAFLGRDADGRTKPGGAGGLDARTKPGSVGVTLSSSESFCSITAPNKHRQCSSSSGLELS